MEGPGKEAVTEGSPTQGPRQDDSGRGNQGSGQPGWGCALVCECFQLDYSVIQQTLTKLLRITQVKPLGTRHSAK